MGNFGRYKAQQHTIGSGETLSEIARDYGMTTQQFLDVNPQITDPNLIYAGSTLNIPSSATNVNYSNSNTTTIESGDTLSELALDNNTTVSELLDLNPQITDPNRIYAGDRLNLPTESQYTAKTPSILDDDPNAIKVDLDGDGKMDAYGIDSNNDGIFDTLFET